MKYFMLLANSSELPEWTELSAEEQQAEMAKHGAFAEACEAAAGVEIVGGEALDEADTATTVRTRDGELVTTDGPFAEAAEHIGGYYLLEAPDLDTVVALCGHLPAYDIEIRPTLDVG